MFSGCFWPRQVFRGPGGWGGDFLRLAFQFFLGLFSWFGGYPGVSEHMFYPLFVRGKGSGSWMWGFGAVLGYFSET